jgi:DNA-binding transcriptional MerR regulator
VRKPNGYRDFPVQAIDEVLVVKRLLAAGLSVADIVTLQPCLTAVGEFDGCAEARATLRRHISRLGAAIQRDQETLAQLREREQNMSPSPAAERPAV